MFNFLNLYTYTINAKVWFKHILLCKLHKRIVQKCINYILRKFSRIEVPCGRYNVDHMTKKNSFISRLSDNFVTRFIAYVQYTSTQPWDIQRYEQFKLAFRTYSTLILFLLDRMRVNYLRYLISVFYLSKNQSYRDIYNSSTQR